VASLNFDPLNLHFAETTKSSRNYQSLNVCAQKFSEFDSYVQYVYTLFILTYVQVLYVDT